LDKPASSGSSNQPQVFSRGPSSLYDDSALLEVAETIEKLLEGFSFDDFSSSGKDGPDAKLF